MITWEQLAATMVEGVLALKTEPFDPVVTRDDFSIVQDFALGEIVDNACRYFAHHQAWPDTLTTIERRAVVQRMLLATFIARTMHVSVNARDDGFLKQPQLPDIEARLVLEWLLIWAWKAGGPKLMPHYRTVLFNVLDYAGMNRQLAPA